MCSTLHKYSEYNEASIIITALLTSTKHYLLAMDSFKTENDDDGDATISSAVTTIVSNRTPCGTARIFHSQQVCILLVKKSAQTFL
jgi:hypothetical protein